jgi:ribA/ribD-fused uncharacterized protein
MADPNTSFIKFLTWKEDGKWVHSPGSNFFIEADGTHVEGEFQATKSGLSGLALMHLRRAYCQAGPGKAKKMGRQTQLRPDWEAVKFDIMKELVTRKFTEHEECSAWLVGTKQKLIVETNSWHDNYWGNCWCNKCNGKGKNKLGKILMDVREVIRG